MKVNGNKKNNPDRKSNELMTDEISANAVRVLEEVPLKSFDSEEVWKKLINRMGQVDKRFVTWGLAMAASFSLLIAAKTEMFEWDALEEDLPASAEIVLNNVEKKSNQIGIGERIVIPRLEIAAIKTPKKEILAGQEEYLINITTNENSLATTNDHQEMDLAPFANPFIYAFGKVNFDSDRLSPELGIDFKIAEHYTAKRRNIYKVGLSTQFNMTSSETSKRQIHPHTFVNFEFSSLNKSNHKGWTSRAGYLLNPDGQVYQDTTIKVALFRTIGKHLKFGPEVIFTNNLKKAMPSISLILG